MIVLFKKEVFMDRHPLTNYQVSMRLQQAASTLGFLEITKLTVALLTNWWE
jgi:hypothetical protein